MSLLLLMSQWYLKQTQRIKDLIKFYKIQLITPSIIFFDLDTISFLFAINVYMK